MEENSELESIKEKRMEELKQRLAQQQAKQEDALKAEMQLDAALKHLLSPEAKARLSNVKLVNEQLYLGAAQAVLYLAKLGKIGAHKKLGDAQMKELLEKISKQTKREIKIKRK
jgi:programmed cell death protein 5